MPSTASSTVNNHTVNTTFNGSNVDNTSVPVMAVPSAPPPPPLLEENPLSAAAITTVSGDDSSATAGDDDGIAAEE